MGVIDDRLVTYSMESKLYIPRTIQVPESAVFGWGVTNTEVAECGYCYALVTKERELSHEMWHREQEGLAGQ